MKYDLKEKSLFELFKNYPKDYVLFTIETFEQETISTSLLIRHYGVNFDGTNAKRNLTFNEKDRLKLLLGRFETRLKYIDAMIKNKHSFKEIKQILKNKKDYEIDKIALNCTKSKEKEIKVVIFKTKNEAVRMLNATAQTITDAIEYLENSSLRFVFKYTYGFGCIALDELKIRNILKIPEEEYNKLLKTACEAMPKCIEKQKEQMSILNTQRTTQNKQKIAVSLNREKRKVVRRIPCFYDCFYPENVSDEEKKTIIEKIKYAIMYQKKHAEKQYKVFSNIYDPITGKVKENAPNDEITRKIFYDFKSNIQKLIETNTLEELKQRASGEKRKKKICSQFFLDNFCTSEMSEIEKEKIYRKGRLALIYQKNKSEKGYQVFCSIYDEETLKLIPGKELEEGFRQNYYRFEKAISNLIKNNTIEELEKVVKRNKEKRKEEFPQSYLTILKEIEEEPAKEKVLLAIQILKYNLVKSYEVFCVLYDKETLERIGTLKDYEENKKNFNLFTNKLKAKIKNTTLEELQKELQQIQLQKELPVSFYDWFPEIEDKKKITLVIAILENTSKKGYEIFTEFYDKETLELKENAELDSQKKKTLLHFRFKINQMCKENALEELEAERKKPIPTKSSTKLCLSFLDYFYEEEMSDKEKLERDELVTLAVLYQQSCNTKAFKTFSNIYDVTTLKIKENACLGENKSNFQNFKISIDKLIAKYSKEEIKAKTEAKKEPIGKKENKKVEKELETSFLDYFPEINKQIDTKQKILLAIQILKNGAKKGYEVFTSVYEEKTLELKETKKLDAQKSTTLSRFINKIKRLCKQKSLEELETLASKKAKPLSKKQISILNSSYLEYFYEEGMNEEEKKKINELVKLAIIYQQMYSPKKYEEFCALYDTKTLELKENAYLRNKLNFQNFKNSIHILIRNNSLEGLKKKCLNYIKQEKRKIKEAKKEEINSIINEAKVQSKENAYLDALILRCYEMCPDSAFILSTLKISQSALIDSYIRNLINFKEPSEVIDYIIKNQPSYITQILTSGVFGDFKGALTEKEQQFIYLRLLQRVDDTITEEKIAYILDIDIENLENYEIMTNDEQVNKLNLYIKNNK